MNRAHLLALVALTLAAAPARAADPDTLGHVVPQPLIEVSTTRGAVRPNCQTKRHATTHSTAAHQGGNWAPIKSRTSHAHAAPATIRA